MHWSKCQWQEGNKAMGAQEQETLVGEMEEERTAEEHLYLRSSLTLKLYSVVIVF